MKKVILLILASNIVLSSAIFLRQRLKRKSRVDSDSSLQDLGATTYIDLDGFNISQKLDHFDKENDQTWYQRYWNSATHYKPGGPVFLLVNGEWSVDGYRGFDEAWVSYAKKLNALCFSLEHRFYGKSWPGKGNFHHLSSAQALGDIANFIRIMNEEFNLPKDTKWILFGCSYGGMLAAWARLKYSHLVLGAIASSAPLASEVDFHDYDQLVEDTLKSHDPKCIESITQAVNEMAALISSTKNKEKFSRIFNLCDDENEVIGNNAKNLFSDIIEILAQATQYNDTTEINIPVVCDIMISHNGSKLEALAELRRRYIESHKYDDVDPSADRSWDYQVCSELGGFSNYNKTPSLSALSHLIPIEIDIKDRCEPFFGPNFGVKELNEKMIETNVLYGGLHFNVGNTVFIQGSTDPWYTSGLYKQKKDSIYETIFINGASHCSDTVSFSNDNIPSIKIAHKEILQMLKKWLKK